MQHTNELTPERLASMRRAIDAVLKHYGDPYVVLSLNVAEYGALVEATTWAYQQPAWWQRVHVVNVEPEPEV